MVGSTTSSDQNMPRWMREPTQEETGERQRLLPTSIMATDAHAERKHTDILFTVLFVVYCIGMIALTAYALVSPRNNAIDYNGDACHGYLVNVTPELKVCRPMLDLDNITINYKSSNICSFRFFN